MIFQTARFDFWSCISNEVKWGQVFYSFHAVFNEFELVKVFAILFLQVLSVGGDIVSVKTGSRLLFANQLFRFFFFFSVWSIGLPRINFFLINRFVLKYTWILKWVIDWALCYAFLDTVEWPKFRLLWRWFYNYFLLRLDFSHHLETEVNFSARILFFHLILIF